MKEYSSLISQFKKHIFKPIYFFMGEEPFFIDKLTQAIEKYAIDEAHKSFDLITLYGKEVDIPQIIGAAKRYPMMAPKQVIIVKEAQHLVNSLDKLINYIKEPNEACILVFNFKYKKIDKRKAVYKTLNKHKFIYTSDKLYDNKIPNFIAEWLEPHEIKISPKGQQMLVDNLGTDLTKIENALEKLILIAKDSKLIKPKMIEDNIGISKDFNNFEFQKALGLREIAKAYKIAYFFAQNPRDHPIVVTISVLYNFYKNLIIYHTLVDKSRQNIANTLKINPFFVTDYTLAAQKFPLKKVVQNISVLKEIDLKSKGVGTTQNNLSDLLKELVFKLTH